MERGRRARAVRLTDDALALFKERLRARSVSGRGGSGSNVTAQAKCLGMDRATVRKILSQSGNDRAVIRLAFDRLGLPWDDDRCVPVGEPGL